MPIRSSCDKNFNLMQLYLPELLLPNPQNLAQLGYKPQKMRGIFRVKPRTTNTKELKLVDPETMGGWS